MGPFSKLWYQDYTNNCDDETEHEEVTVEECKQICENEHGCNVLVFRNKNNNKGPYTSCNLRKCPIPIPPPDRNPNPSHNASYYLTSRQFNSVTCI